MNRPLPRAVLGRLQVRKGEPPPAVRWGSFGDREWRRALGWLDLSGLAIYFLHRMKGSRDLDVLPDGVRKDLERRAADNRVRTAGILQELGFLSAAFKAARVEYAVLKGTSLVPDYCTDPALRTQYDHDVLVDGSSLDAAEKVLQGAGYRRKNRAGESAIVYRQPEPEIRFSEDSEGLYSCRLQRSIELHPRLWEETEEKIRIDLPDDFLERGRLRCWEGLEYRALCDEDGLLFQVLHAFKHILRNWCRLSMFLEIAHFLDRRSSDSAFWSSFAGRIESVRWAPEATLVVFTLAGRLFGAVVPPQLQASLATGLSPALNLWIERYGRRSALSNFHGDKCSLFLHEEFVDSRLEWSTIRRRRLFPLQRPHRPPAVVFQRGFSTAGRLWMESAHAVRRLRFHGLAGLRYTLEYPRWILLRRMRLAAGSGDA